MPNIITCSRVLLAGALVVLMSLPDFATGATDNRKLMAAGLGLFVVAALSDALDGYLARRWSVTSVFGRIMDPFADKILVLGTFVMLAGPQFSMMILASPPTDGFASPDLGVSVQVSGIASWMVVVILARDLLITTLRGMVEGRGMSFAALPAGKIKMIVQSVAIPAILLTLALSPDPTQGAARWIILASAWGVTLTTALSGIPYVIDASRKLTTP